MLKTIFNSLSLLDFSGKRLSLTNLLLYICMIKFAITNQISVAEISALFLALLNYGAKRHVSNAAAQTESATITDLTNQLDQAKQEFETATKQLTDKVEAHSELAKETQQIITNVKMNQNMRKY